MELLGAVFLPLLLLLILLPTTGSGAGAGMAVVGAKIRDLRYPQRLPAHATDHGRVAGPHHGAAVRVRQR